MRKAQANLTTNLTTLQQTDRGTKCAAAAKCLQQLGKYECRRARHREGALRQRQPSLA